MGRHGDDEGVTQAVAVVWFRSWAELRSRWRSWLGLSLLVCISTGVVLFTLAGARRTDTARLGADRARAIAMANLVAALPGRAAARTAPALGLRWE